MIKEIDAGKTPECVDVIRKSFATVAKEFGFTEENAPRFTAFATTKERLEYQLYNEHRLMYAYLGEDDKIIGYYSLLLKGKECELNNLCVIPEYRHCGIGAKLLQDVYIRAEENGCEIINIGIVEENTVLRKWYEDNGFIHTGTKKFDFFPFTCGYMIKKL